MNVHHLELFYYVARFRGIMPAVRNIPYGIQQPAVSSQIAQLEQHLGVTLFQRRPFALTAEGNKLFEFIQPFFANLEQISIELQGGQAKHIRIGASSILLREYLPELFNNTRKKFSALKISLLEGFPGTLAALVADGEIDLALTVIEEILPAGVQGLTLIELPMVLLVPAKSSIQSADELLSQEKIEHPLICLPPAESVCKKFQQQLSILGVEWFPSIEISSTDLVEIYVANGLGVGLSLALPKKTLGPKVRALPLRGFPKIQAGALWRGRKTPLLEYILTEAQKHVRRLS